MVVLKIKQERKVRLDELLKFVWDNDIKNENFKSAEGLNIYIHSDGDVDFDEVNYISKNDLFTITEEVEVTEDTPLQRAMVIKNNLDFYSIKNRKINSLKTINIKFIYLQNEDGSIGDLIWSKERGLID